MKEAYHIVVRKPRTGSDLWTYRVTLLAPGVPPVTAVRKAPHGNAAEEVADAIQEIDQTFYSSKEKPMGG